MSGGGSRLGWGEGKELAPYAYRSHRAPEEHIEVPAVPKFLLHFPTRSSGFSNDCNDVISGRIRPFHGQVLPDHRARQSRGSWRKVGKLAGTWGWEPGCRGRVRSRPSFLGHPPPLAPEHFPTLKSSGALLWAVEFLRLFNGISQVLEKLMVHLEEEQPKDSSPGRPGGREKRSHLGPGRLLMELPLAPGTEISPVTLTARKSG